VQEFQYAAQLSAADLENERLIEQATLAQIYFEIRGQDALQKVLNEMVTVDKKLLELAQGAYVPGVGDMISVVQAQNTLENTQAQAINVGVARAQFEHAIAVLIGKSASSFSIPVKPTTTEPPPIPVGVPSQLLQRRPDIAAAERAMAQANAQIGIAKTAFYPTLNLTAAGGFESSTLGNLFLWSSRIWAIGGSLTETVFDAGLRRATVNQFIATYNATVAAYRQTVLTAFQQVEDSLAATRILSQQAIKLREAIESADTALRLEIARYETGIDPYMNVMIAQIVLLTDRETLVTTQVSEMVAAVQLIMALGGGWDRSELPTTKQVSEKPTKMDTKINR
jgi:NodT family efflux transporter outer membrane factor (OMF) lipoprotein